MRSVSVSALLASALFLSAQPDDASKFSARVLQNRDGLSVRDGQFTGTGAEVLRTAIAHSRFVLLGETHGLAEVARFAGAVCKLAEPEGFHTLAIEEGPLVTTELERWARRTDAREQLAGFLKRYMGTCTWRVPSRSTSCFSHARRVLTNRRRLEFLYAQYCADLLSPADRREVAIRERPALLDIGGSCLFL